MIAPLMSQKSLPGVWLLSVLCLGLVGSQATGSPVEDDQPNFSRLAGRWWVSLRDFVEIGQRGKTATEASRFAEKDRLLIVTILPDGSCDWSRTYLGVRDGLHSLRNVGDRCIAHKFAPSAYEVIASE